GRAEDERLDALRRYDILDTPPEEAFDRLTRLAAACFDAPTALITLVDAGRQWFKSCIGTDLRETDREISFCARAIQSEGVTVVLDATEDPRFSGNPFVTGEKAHIRFYAGAPLVTPEGHALGTLCVIDVEARAAFGPEQQARLEDLAATAMDEMEHRRVEAQRREAEEALRRSEKRSRKLIEHSADALAVLEADGTIRHQSHTSAHIAGRPPEDTAGTLPFGRMHPDDRKRVRAAFESLMEHPDEVMNVRYRTRHSEEDRWVHVESVGRNLLDEPAVEGLVVNSRDVTERREREKHLRLMDAAMEHAEDGVLITEAHSLDEPGPKIVYANDAFCENTGYAREEVLGRNPRFLQGPETDRAELDHLRAALEAEEPVRAELTNYKKDGTPFWVEMSVMPVFDAEGRCTHFTSIQRDVSERKRAEAALEESKERFRKLVEHSSDIVTIQNADGTIRYESPAVKDVLGREPGSAADERPVDAVHPDDAEQMHALREKLFRNPGEVVTARFRTQHADGHWVPIEAVGKNMLDDPVVQGIVVHARDVTDTVRYEAERAARQRAEELLEAKTTFLNNMSHELRTPLTSILGFAEVLAEESEGDQQEFAGCIAESGRRLQQTLDSILRLAKLDAQGGEGALQIEPTDVSEVAHKAASAHRPAIEEKGLTLTVEHPPEEEDAPRAMADAGALNRVLDNLLSNAVKFTEEGGVAVRVETRPQQVLLCVEDTGIGIGEDFQEQLFTDFTQESVGSTRTHEGSGLGLAITQRLVQMMDGTVEVDSARGEGTTFAVHLPRPAADGEEPASEDPDSEDPDSGEEEAPGASPTSSIPDFRKPMLGITSTSSAPAATASLTALALAMRPSPPIGKPAAEQTETSVPASSSRASGTQQGRTIAPSKPHSRAPGPRRACRRSAPALPEAASHAPRPARVSSISTSQASSLIQPREHREQARRARLSAGDMRVSERSLYRARAEQRAATVQNCPQRHIRAREWFYGARQRLRPGGRRYANGTPVV
ncbi:MAG: hypothetical protein BRD48_04880, partial [Bacteroidetes bacterium QS_9_68_14]